MSSIPERDTLLNISAFIYWRSLCDMTGYILRGRQISPYVTARSADVSTLLAWIYLPVLLDDKC